MKSEEIIELPSNIHKVDSGLNNNIYISVSPELNPSWYEIR